MYRLLLLFLAFPAFSNAALIIETWKTTLTGGHILMYENGYANRGSEIYWSVSYDDTAGRYHVWSDGVNGIGEAGIGDDTLIAVNTNNRFSDAVFNLANFNQLFDRFFEGEGYVSLKRLNFNMSFTERNPYTGKRGFSHWQDETTFAVQGNDGFSSFGRSASRTSYGVTGTSEFVQYGTLSISEPKQIFLLAIFFLFVLRCQYFSAKR